MFSSAGIITLANLIFLFTPVVRFFSYEAAVLNGVLITLLSGLLYFKYPIGEEGALPFVKRVLLLLAIPPLLYFVFHLFRGDCSFVSGLKYYLIFTVTAPLVGMGISALVLLTGLKYKRSVFVLVFLLVLFNWVIDFYLYPQFFLFNAIFTYYPGVIYDEFIPITEKIIYYRTGIVIFSFLVVVLERKLRQELQLKRFWLAMGLLIGVPALSWSVSNSAGLTTMKEDIISDFRDSIVTEHFFIVSEEDLSPTERYLVAVTHEAYYNQLVEFYGIKPKRLLKSFIFKDNASKKRKLGVENADVAKPWLGVAFTTRPNLEVSLKHEIAHLFTAEFGWGPFEVAAWFDPGLIEGSATAGDGYISGYDIDEFTAAVQASKYRVDPTGVFPGFSFFDINPSLAYALNGSISRYLVEKEGSAKFREYHATGNAEAVYGKPVEHFFPGWEKKISTIKSDITPQVLDFFLERQPLTRKTCPRYIAELMAEAGNLFRQKKYSEAVEVYGKILASNDSFDAFAGKIAALVLLGKTNEALNELKSFDEKGKNYATRARLNLLKYRVAWLAGDSALVKSSGEWLETGKHPEFLIAGHKFAKLLLGRGHNPFSYNALPPEERLRFATRLAAETGEPSAFEEVVDLCYRFVLPFSGGDGLKKYITGLTTSGKLKLCTVMARGDDPESVAEILATIDQKTLPSARETMKYRIFMAVFEK